MQETIKEKILDWISNALFMLVCPSVIGLMVTVFIFAGLVSLMAMFIGYGVIFNLVLDILEL